MAVMRDRPVLNTNFLVDFGDGRSREVSGGFSEVLFPEFRIESGERSGPEAAADRGVEPKPACLGNRLILKRGVCGALDLYAWWHRARNGKAPRRRSLKIHLLAEDHETVVMSWRFHHVRPVALSYSPLRAQEGAAVIETIEIAFDRFEMSGATRLPNGAVLDSPV